MLKVSRLEVKNKKIVEMLVVLKFMMMMKIPTCNNGESGERNNGEALTSFGNCAGDVDGWFGRVLVVDGF